MRVLITGGRGLIGQSLIGHLRRDRRIEITATSRAHPSEEPTVRWIQSDLRDLAQCRLLVEAQDAIIHLAQPAIPLTADGDLATEVHVNLVTTLNLITAIRSAAHRPRVLFPSSGGAVYGDTGDRPFRETDCCKPANSYGLLKLTVEHYLRLAAEHGEMRVVILRLANAYGNPLPPDRMQGLIGTAVSRVRAGLPVRVIGRPDNIRDYVHTDDVAEAFRRALELDCEYEVLNVGSGQGTSVREVISMIAQLSPLPVAQVVHAHPNADRLPGRVILDIARAREILDWHPVVPLEDGIERMLRC